MGSETGENTNASNTSRRPARRPRRCRGTIESSTTTAHADGSTQNVTVELPPGLSPDGVDDPFALAQAHDQMLQNVSYTMSTTDSVRRLNGTLIGHGSTAERVAAGGERFRTVRSQASRNTT